MVLAVLIGSPTPGLGEADGDGAWERVRQEDGIELLRRLDGGPGPAFRARAEVEADLFEVLAVLADDPRRTEWMSRCIESRRVAELEDGTRLIYSRTAGSWPVADRDGVVATRVSIDERGHRARVEMRSTETPDVPPVPGVVRMPALTGAYELVALGPDRTRVRYEIDVDLGGRVPGFVGSFVREQMPFDTLRDLRGQVERTRDSYAAAAQALRRRLPDVASPAPPKPAGDGMLPALEAAPTEARHP